MSGISVINKNHTRKKLAPPFLAQPPNFKKVPRASQKIFLSQIFSNTTYFMCTLWENYEKPVPALLEGRKIKIYKNVTGFPEELYAPT